MNDKEHIVRQDYSALDVPEITGTIFPPMTVERGETPAGCTDLDVVVDDGVVVSLRAHLPVEKDGPNILFFHGNGETVSDYDDIGPNYTALGLGFIAVDYRGYGWSSGEPSVTSMIRDSYLVFDQVREFLNLEGRAGNLLIMGRSLGCVPALELATFRHNQMAGLIIESGFANTCPLLNSIGVDVEAQGINEENGFGNLLKIKALTKPVLILHAQNDQLIPINEAAELHAHCGSAGKEIQTIPGADHNNILQVTGRMYYEAIDRFARKAGRPRRRKKSGVR